MDIYEVIRELGGSISGGDIIFLAGILIFSNWLLKTSLGRAALADSVPRRNNMPVHLPFIPLIIWFGAVSVPASVVEAVGGEWTGQQRAFADNLILCVGAIAVMGVIIFLARAHFARRLAGFGLNVKTIGRDFLAAVVNLVSVWPLMTVVIMMTILFGGYIWGPKYTIEQHEELKMIAAYPQLSVRVLIGITTVIIVPAFEEMLFRGMFQTMIRSFLAKPWLSIVIASGLFAAVHSNAGHWPGLFVLSMCMGYAYEKSGSLLRPIFIHSLFNASSIIATLAQ